MAGEPKEFGFVLIRAYLGARQEFEVHASPKVNANDSEAKYERFSDGTDSAVFVSVLKKLAAAIGAGASRVTYNVTDKLIEG